MKYTRFVLLVGLFCLAKSQPRITPPDVKLCLTKIMPDDGFIAKYEKPDVSKPSQKTVQVTNKNRLLQATVISDQHKDALVNLIKAYFGMNSSTQTAIKECKPSSAGALSRCELANGKGNCDIVAPGLAHKKCPSGLVRKGHSICTVKCPEGYTDRALDCYKPAGYKTPRYSSKTECEAAGSACEKFNLLYHVPICKSGFVRSGADACIPVCPEGWLDLGRKCLRTKVVNLGNVFVWNPEDN